MLFLSFSLCLGFVSVSKELLEFSLAFYVEASEVLHVLLLHWVVAYCVQKEASSNVDSDGIMSDEVQ